MSSINKCVWPLPFYRIGHWPGLFFTLAIALVPSYISVIALIYSLHYLLLLPWFILHMGQCPGLFVIDL